MQAQVDWCCATSFPSRLAHLGNPAPARPCKLNTQSLSIGILRDPSRLPSCCQMHEIVALKQLEHLALFCLFVLSEAPDRLPSANIAPRSVSYARYILTIFKGSD